MKKSKRESPRTPRSDQPKPTETSTVIAANIPQPPPNIMAKAAVVPNPMVPPKIASPLSSPRKEKKSSPRAAEKLTHPTIERPMPPGRRPTIRSHTVSSFTVEEEKSLANNVNTSDVLRAELEALKLELKKKDVELQAKGSELTKRDKENAELKSAANNQMSAKDAEIKKLREELEEERRKGSKVPLFYNILLTH